MTSPADWLAGARPRTLPAAVAPVLAGTGVAAYVDEAVWWKALLALVVSLALQVGVNYANDYSDGVRGTDDELVGPMRLVGSGAASAPAVKRAAFLAFGVAAVAGLALAAATAWWLVAVGAVSGFFAGIFGIGGGAILVPVFYECFRTAGVPLEVRMPLCIGTSLAIIIPTSIRSFRAHYARGAVDLEILKQWWLPIVIGVIAGSITAG